MESHTIGLDIGIASVGWCVLGERRIIDLGVRAFDKAETAKEGESLNKVRRDARLMRHRLQNRAWRLTKLARRLKKYGLIENIAVLKAPPCNGQKTPNLWALRVAALDRCLSPEEWARVIYHLCKHRGFHWISRAEEKKADEDKTGEGGKVKQGLAGTKKLMAENGYRSVAEMVLAVFPTAQRNKAGDYGKALSRVLLAHELAQLFQRQRELGNRHADSGLEETILGQGDRQGGLFWQQKPALAGAQLLAMLGKCTFEKSEYRAPKASFTAERHVWLTRLNNLRIVVDGSTRPLNEAERLHALPLPYKQAGDFTYKQLHAALAKKGLLPESFAFAGLRSSKGKDPLSERLVKLPAWQELRSAFKKAGLETEWEGLAGAAMSGNPETLDRIARVLTVFKDGEEVERELRALALPGAETTVQALLDLGFSDFHALSLKALRKIVPLMERGLRYDEAVTAIPEYGHHSQLATPLQGKQRYLPPFYAKRDEKGRMVFAEDLDVPKNPVVLRALNQARKVVNAIIREYGPPQAVHIEMARDLSRPLNGRWTKEGRFIEGRRDVEKEQENFRERNEKDKADFAEFFGRPPKGNEFEKYRLYREQHGQCAYSQQPLAPNGNVAAIFADGATEIDHALPYSRSFDDSKNNKVLVLSKENRDKGNLTPFEYFYRVDGEAGGPRWQRYVAYVEGNKSYRQAKRTRLLRKDFGDKEAEGFRERNLNDTRYICRFFKNFVERYLQLADDSTAKRCVVISGQLTAFLRARWGLHKERGDSDRHHALDAAVVAACSHAMVKRLSDYARHKELSDVRNGFPDPETGEIIDPALFRQIHEHFPDPWPHFRHELLARLNTDDPRLLREDMARLGTYPETPLASLRPLFVSRAAQKRGSGPIHEETIRSAKLIDKGKSFVRTPLYKLKLADLDNIVGATFSHNHKMIALLRERLTTHGDDGKKAFADPVFKPSSSDIRGPEIKKVKVISTQKGGVRIRGGVAELGPMHHVDVYRLGKGFQIYPAYIASHATRISNEVPPDNAVFCFSLTKHDYVEISFGDKKCSGYFVMYESDGRLTLRAHDQPIPDKNYFRKSVLSATNMRKFNVDVLGNIYPAPVEARRGLA